MMSTSGFRENRPSAPQGQQQPFATANSANLHSEQIYYQMSRMQAPLQMPVPQQPSNVAFPTTSASSTAPNLPFFSTPSSVPGTTHYASMAANAAPKAEYGDRSISDEMMRHLLLSANSAPPPNNQGQIQQQQPAQQFAALPKIEKDEHVANVPQPGKRKSKGSRAVQAPGDKPIRKKKRRAFEFYWEELRGEYAKTHSSLGHNERRAIAQAEWKDVTNRDKWQRMADEYNEKMLNEKYSHRPKPPVTANAFFFKEQHVLLRQQRPELKGGAVLAEISKMWERCTDRSRWIEMQAADRRRYESEMAAYKASQAGHGHS